MLNSGALRLQFWLTMNNMDMTENRTLPHGRSSRQCINGMLARNTYISPVDVGQLVEPFIASKCVKYTNESVLEPKSSAEIQLAFSDFVLEHEDTKGAVVHMARFRKPFGEKRYTYRCLPYYRSADASGKRKRSSKNFLVKMGPLGNYVRYDLKP